MPSAWHTPDDPRELHDLPVVLRCDRCDRPYPVHPDNVPDEIRLCVRCTLAVARAPMPLPQDAA